MSRELTDCTSILETILGMPVIVLLTYPSGENIWSYNFLKFIYLQCINDYKKNKLILQGFSDVST